MQAVSFQQVAPGGRGRYFIALSLLACYYYTIPVITTPLGYTTYVRLDDLASLLFALVSFSSILNRQKFPETRFLGLMLLALFCAPLSAAWSFVISGQLRGLELGLWQTVQYAKICLVFSAAMVLPMDWRRLRRIMFFAWIGSLAVGVYGTLQYYGVISIRPLVERFAASGPWDFGQRTFEKLALGPLSHNYACMGAYMVVAVSVTIFLLRTASGVFKIAYIASLPFFMLVMLWSTSRSGFFSLFVGLLVYMLASRIKPAAIVSLAAAGICAYAVLSTVPELREAILWRSGETATEYSAGRLEGWSKLLLYLFSHPYYLVTGIGLGNFTTYLTPTVGLMAGHNNYLHWLTEGGIIGLLIPLLLFWRLGKLLWAGAASSAFGREISRVFLALLVAVAAAAAFQEIFTPNIALASFPAYFAFLFGSVVAFYRTTWLRSVYGYATVGDESPHWPAAGRRPVVV